MGFERQIEYDARGRADRVRTADRGWIELAYTAGASLVRPLHPVLGARVAVRR